MSTPNVFASDQQVGQAVTNEEFASYVLDRVRHESVLIQAGARLVTSSAKSLVIPRILTDAALSWFAELDDMSVNAPDADSITLAFKKVGGVLKVGRETVLDSDPAALQVLGDNLAKALALEMDKQLFAGDGTGNKPTGFLSGTDINGTPTPLQTAGTAIDYAGIITARGAVKASGAKPRVLFVSPASETALALQTDAMDRPLLTGTADGTAEQIGGLRVFVTPALSMTAVVAEPEQIIVGLRQDAQIAISDQAAFASDAVLIKISARADVGINDPAGIAVIPGA